MLSKKSYLPHSPSIIKTISLSVSLVCTKMSCPFLNSMENFELIDMRHDFEELTDLQVNSFIFVVEESNMQLTPATNFNTLFVRMEYFDFSIWVANYRFFYTHYKYALEQKDMKSICLLILDFINPFVPDYFECIFVMCIKIPTFCDPY